MTINCLKNGQKKYVFGKNLHSSTIFCLVCLRTPISLKTQCFKYNAIKMLHLDK